MAFINLNLPIFNLAEDICVFCGFYGFPIIFEARPHTHSIINFSGFQVHQKMGTPSFNVQISFLISFFLQTTGMKSYYTNDNQ